VASNEAACSRYFSINAEDTRGRGAKLSESVFDHRQAGGGVTLVLTGAEAQKPVHTTSSIIRGCHCIIEYSETTISITLHYEL